VNIRMHGATIKISYIVIYNIQKVKLLLLGLVRVVHVISNRHQQRSYTQWRNF